MKNRLVPLINIFIISMISALALMSCGKSGVNLSKTDTTKTTKGIIGGASIYVGGYESTTNDIRLILKNKILQEQILKLIQL